MLFIFQKTYTVASMLKIKLKQFIEVQTFLGKKKKLIEFETSISFWNGLTADMKLSVTFFINLDNC